MKELWILAIITLVLMWILKRWRERHQILLCTKIPARWWHIIKGFGYILTSKGTIKETNRDILKYGKNAIVYVGPCPILLTIDPETIKDVFSAKNCVNKPDFFYKGLANSFERGLITISDPHWGNERRIVNAAFNNKNLMSFIPIFNKEANLMLQNIEKQLEEQTNTHIISYFREYTVRIATRTLIGRDIDKTNYSGMSFAEGMNEFAIYSSQMMFNQLFIIGLTRKIAQLTIYANAVKMREGIKSLITESFRNFATKRGVDASYDTSINTAADYMAKGVEQNKMKDTNVTGDLLHLYLGAFETTSSSLYYILIMLGMHPEVQQRAYEEVCNLFPDDDDDEQFEVTYEDIGQMVYIDMIMNETMRFLPIIPHAAREVVDKDLTLSSGIVLPKGLCVVVDIYSLHRSKLIWGPAADKFDPDNFLPSNIEAKHPYSFIPFTKGLRFCIGWRYAQLSIKTALAKLIKRYKFTAHCKLDDLELENHVTSRLKKDPPLIIERRKKPKSL